MTRASRGGIGRASVVVALLSAALSSLVAVAPVTACSGGRLQVGDESLEDAARAIFAGTVVSRDEEIQWLGGSDFLTYQWTFVVDEVERGEVGGRFTVASTQGSAACGVEFQLGARYRVRAYDGVDSSRLEVISGDADPMPALARPPGPKGVFGPSSDLSLLVVILLPILLVGLVVFTLHRPRRPGRSTE